MAETLEKIYSRYKMAETVEVYKKADASMTLPSQKEYDDLPAGIKAKYRDYAEYRDYVRNQNNMVKDAIKVKVDEVRAKLALDSSFTSEEKAQYDSELSGFSGTVKPLTQEVIK